MRKEYKKIAHRLDMRYVEKARGFVESRLINQTFKEIKTQNIDILRPIKDEPKLYLPYPHSAYSDTVIIPYILLTNDLPYPVTAAGDNLINIPVIGWYLKKFGCYTFKRKHMSPKEVRLVIDYTAYLLSEERRDVVFFSGFTEYEDGRKKGGRGWDGKLQEISRFPIRSAAHCYENGIDPNIIPVIITYEPYGPDEFAFELLMEGEIPTKHLIARLFKNGEIPERWYIKLGMKLGGRYLVKFADMFNAMFPPRRELTAHAYFDGPYPFSKLSKMFSAEDYRCLSNIEKNYVIRSIEKYLERKAKEHYMITPLDLYAALIPTYCNGREYNNDDIMENMSKLLQKLYGKVDMSLIDDNILEKVKVNKYVVKIDDNKTIVKDKSLVEYHRNRVLSLLN